MALFRTANPALRPKTFDSVRTGADAALSMTLQGTVNKTGILLTLVAVSATFTWNAYRTNPAAAVPWLVLGLIGGFIVAMVTIFKKEWAVFTAPLYAILEGLLLGALSATFEARYPGIAIQAVALTFGTLLAMLIAYTSGLVKATQNFKMGVVAATGGIMVVYLATMGLGFFGIHIPYIYNSGIVGIGFSLFVVIIAALNLVLDFDLVDSGVASGAPKFMEWYCAFGLLVTLVWLYIEMLRLLSKINRR
ncbi:MAG: Bax inhibitor-1/YccA family membrane protein [Terriglobia bacterium]